MLRQSRQVPCHRFSHHQSSFDNQGNDVLILILVSSLLPQNHHFDRSVCQIMLRQSHDHIQCQSSLHLQVMLVHQRKDHSNLQYLLRCFQLIPAYLHPAYPPYRLQMLPLLQQKRQYNTRGSVCAKEYTMAVLAKRLILLGNLCSIQATGSSKWQWNTMLALPVLPNLLWPSHAICFYLSTE